jgi:hypothetical protein
MPGSDRSSKAQSLVGGAESLPRSTPFWVAGCPSGPLVAWLSLAPHRPSVDMSERSLPVVQGSIDIARYD